MADSGERSRLAASRRLRHRARVTMRGWHVRKKDAMTHNILRSSTGTPGGCAAPWQGHEHSRGRQSSVRVPLYVAHTGGDRRGCGKMSGAPVSQPTRPTRPPCRRCLPQNTCCNSTRPPHGVLCGARERAPELVEIRWRSGAARPREHQHGGACVCTQSHCGRHHLVPISAHASV